MAWLVDLVNRRTLSIYLWHGLGLVVAQRLVQDRLGPGIVNALAALAVVVAVTAGAVVVFGPVEDMAAGRRRPARAARPRRPASAIAVRLGGVVLALGLIGVSMAPLDGSSPSNKAAPAAPLSGRAVVARAGLIEDALDQAPSTTEVVAADDRPSPGDVVQAWLLRHPDLQERVGFTELAGAFVTASGEASRFEWRAGQGEVVVTAVPDGAPTPSTGSETELWWSMTKSVTATWLLRTVEAGTVRLDQTIDAWLPEVPHASEITLEQLARHRSGIPPSLDAPLLDANPAADLARFQREPDLDFAPGTGFGYSRLGYVTLALALERATGTTWRAAVEAMAAEAGVTLRFDDDLDPLPEVSDPDGHGYRGRLWSSGGVVSDVVTQARFVRWMLTDGLAPESRAAMTDFSADPAEWFYGIGMMPLCPCDQQGDRLRSTRFGLDSVTGSFAVDGVSGAGVILRPNSWFDEGGPRVEFYELESELLDSLRDTVSPPPPDGP